jgi:hypothetical protein
MSRIYSKQEIQMLENTDLSAKCIGDRLNICAETVYRYRRKNGIKTVYAKPNRKPTRSNRETRTCCRDECDNTFTVIKSHKKRYCSRSCFFIENNPAHNGKPRSIRNPDRTEYKRYAGQVHLMSQKVYEENIDIINPKCYNRAVAGTKGGWQLDHIRTIKECFEQGVSIEQASSLENLRMLPWKENLKRNKK